MRQTSISSEAHVGWVVGKKSSTKRERTTTKTEPTAAKASSPVKEPKTFPDFQHPSLALLQEHGFTKQEYTQYHDECLKGEKTIL